MCFLPAATLLGARKPPARRRGSELEGGPRERAVDDLAADRPATAADPHRRVAAGLEVPHPLGAGANGRHLHAIPEASGEQWHLTGLARNPARGLDHDDPRTDRQRRPDPGLHQRAHHRIQSAEPGTRRRVPEFVRGMDHTRKRTDPGPDRDGPGGGGRRRQDRARRARPPAQAPWRGTPTVSTDADPSPRPGGDPGAVACRGWRPRRPGAPGGPARRRRRSVRSPGRGRSR